MSGLALPSSYRLHSAFRPLPSYQQLLAVLSTLIWSFAMAAMTLTNWASTLTNFFYCCLSA